MEHRAYRVRGRVQGVGFRWFARSAATDLGLAGTVRNAADGSVEVEVRGPREAVDRFEERLRTGPPTAKVEELRRVEPSAGEPADGFEIVH